jgi:hypothetical protein
MYNLEYWLNGKLSETVLFQRPIGIVRWKKAMLEEGKNHKLGTFKIIKDVQTRPR